MVIITMGMGTVMDTTTATGIRTDTAIHMFP